VIVTKRGRPCNISDEAYQRIAQWKPLKQLASELGVPLKAAERIRTGYYYRQVPESSRN